jgi:hypothetical protein
MNAQQAFQALGLLARISDQPFFAAALSIGQKPDAIHILLALGDSQNS